MALPQMKASMLRRWDKAMFELEARGAIDNHATAAATDTDATQED